MRRRPRVTNRATATAAPDRLRTARPRAQLRAGRTDWYTIRNAHTPVAEVLIYDEIGYWGVTAEQFVRELQDVTASAIDLRINSPGGEVFDGIAIMNALRSHPASVTAYVDGLAASAASFIFQAGDVRIMRPQSQLMIHDAMGLGIGNAAELRELADELDRISDTIASVYAERGDGTVARWRERMRATTWYGADEAVEAGLADDVSATAATNRMPQRSNSWDLSIFGGDRPAAPAATDPQARPEIVVVDRPASPPPASAPQERASASPATPGPTPATTDVASTTWTSPTTRTSPSGGEPEADDPADPDAPVWSEDLAAVFAAAMRPPDESELAAAFRDALHPPGPEPEIPAIDPIEFYNAILEGIA